MKKGTPKLGDVYEVPTPVGLAYIQFTHLKPIDEFPLIRVLPRIYQSRPRDIGEIVSQQELYFAFYVLPYALKSGQITFVSNEPIPHWAKEFPLMRRSASFNGRPGWLIGPASTPGTPDGLRTMMRVTELSPDQKKLSFFNEIVPHAALVHNIVRGWTPERDEELTAHAIAEAESKKAKEPLQSKGEYIDHYLYFPKKAEAQEAAKRMRAKGRFAEIRKGADQKNWLTLAKQPVPIEDDIGDIRAELESLAQEFHGKYDGWGAAI